jgi:hypothetical protein
LFTISRTKQLSYLWWRQMDDINNQINNNTHLSCTNVKLGFHHFLSLYSRTCAEAILRSSWSIGRRVKEKEGQRGETGCWTSVVASGKWYSIRRPSVYHAKLMPKHYAVIQRSTLILRGRWLACVYVHVFWFISRHAIKNKQEKGCAREKDFIKLY